MTALRMYLGVVLISVGLTGCTTLGDPASAPSATTGEPAPVAALPSLAVAPLIQHPEPAPLQPTTPAAAQSLAEAKRQFREGNYGLAERAFRAVVEAHNTNGEAWLGLAATYDQLQRFDLADRAYDRAAQILGARPELLNNRGYSYLIRGDRRKASEYFARARAIDPANDIVVANMALLSGSAAVRR